MTWAAVALLVAGQSAAAEIDADVTFIHGNHIHDVEPATVERGARARVKFSLDEPGFGLRAEGRVRWNDAYRSKAYSDEARDAYELSADWRELYLMVNSANWNLSFGLQQVIWGKADNLRVVDLVNPLDLRDFVLPDLNDYRKPVWALRAGHNIGDWSTEFLFLVGFEPTDFAKPGSEYDVPLFDPQVLQSVKLLPERRPSRSLSSSELGAQFSRSFEGTDLSIFLFATRDDNPVFRQSFEADAQGSTVPTLQAEYRRQFMSGLSVARSLSNGVVIRTEAAFIPNFTYMVGSGGSDGLARSPTLSGLLGADYTWRDWLLSIQASDRYIADWGTSYLVPKHQALYTFSATGNSFAGKLESRVAWSIYSARGDGGWLQLKSTWKPDDHWAYGAGFDLFSGQRTGVFGQFRYKDRAWAELTYRF